ncbi:hypothetical protein AB0026_21835, partial [Klebsiella pneumoniae]
MIGLDFVIGVAKSACPFNVNIVAEHFALITRDKVFMDDALTPSTTRLSRSILFHFARIQISRPIPAFGKVNLPEILRVSIKPP